MKTQYYTASSLDGFLADSDNSLDWLFQFGDVSETSYPQFLSEVGAIAMGSTTYTWILNHQGWPYEQPAWVFSSRRLPKADGANIQFVSGSVQSAHTEMAKVAGGKNLWVAGGGDLAGQFYDAGLLDEIIVTLAPVTLGSGAPLLPRAITNPPLKLLSATPYGTVFVELRYQVCR